jgi:hypothetical protein
MSITKIFTNVKEALEFQSNLRKTQKDVLEVRLHKISTHWIISYTVE